jgi:AraC family transcriptional regulator of adaptative response / DNA-3-methyladenine glycosylase II
MPLLARFRQLFDLDADPDAVDAHLEHAGLGALVARRRGVRIPGAFDGFEAVLRVLGREARHAAPRANEFARRLVEVLGESLDAGAPGLTRLVPTAARVVEAGAKRLVALGASPRQGELIVAVARAMAEGALRLEPSTDLGTARRALADRVGDRLASTIVMRSTGQTLFPSWIGRSSARRGYRPLRHWACEQSGGARGEPMPLSTSGCRTNDRDGPLSTKSLIRFQ